MANSRQLVGKELSVSVCGPEALDGNVGDHLVRHAAREKTEFNQSLLERTIEGEIIPRLMLAHKLSAVCPAASSTGGLKPTADDVAELARLALTHDVGVASCYIEALRVQGLPLESIMLDLLAPAAHLIGEMWKSDLCDFVDVTIATSRLQQILREVGGSCGVDGGVCNSRRVLLASFPGDQHSFGIGIVGEFFRQAGFDVVIATPKTGDELFDAVAAQWFDMVGLSVSCEALLGKLASAIRKIRKVAKNRQISIVVGGRYFNEHPESVERVGADGTASDGRQAVQKLPNLIGLAAKRC